MNASMNYLDGNAAAGELRRIFALDITAAQGQCAHCGATRHFAEAHLYMKCPGIVARCAGCGQVLLRLVNTGGRVFLDMRGMSNLAFSTRPEFEDSGA
jgi:phage FluMu protein Com